MPPWAYPPQPQPAPSRQGAQIVAVLVVAVLVVAGTFAALILTDSPPSSPVAAASSGAAPAAPASTAASPAPSSTHEDPDGKAACDQIKAALDGMAKGGPRVPEERMHEIGTRATWSSRPSIQLDGQLLARRADRAIAARGAADERQALLDLLEAALGLATTCIDLGYVSRFNASGG